MASAIPLSSGRINNGWPKTATLREGWRLSLATIAAPIIQPYFSEQSVATMIPQLVYAAPAGPSRCPLARAHQVFSRLAQVLQSMILFIMYCFQLACSVATFASCYRGTVLVHCDHLPSGCTIHHLLDTLVKRCVGAKQIRSTRLQAVWRGAAAPLATGRGDRKPADWVGADTT